MNERLLQFIWQFQYYNKGELSTDSGEPLRVLFPGHYNTNQGPDFLDARIRTGKTIWAGSIELHIKTSDWNRHKHSEDSNYENVILHVVWEDDGSRNPVPANMRKQDFNSLPAIPVLELKSRIPLLLLQRYKELMKNPSFIPCEKMIYKTNELTWQSWKDRLLAERLMRKAVIVEEYNKENNHHWEASCWRLLAKNFGGKVNAAAFEELARSVPVNLLAKHKQQLHQLEALLFGQAGLLNDTMEDRYYTLLQKEYGFLRTKYKLKSINQPVHFLRMRPGNFPTIRLAQLAALIQQSAHLFSALKEMDEVAVIRALFGVTANDYWHYHYRFGETSVYRQKKTGAAMIDTIIINVVCPLLFAYGSYNQEQQYKDKALLWLEQTTAETNNITRQFSHLGIANKNAADSQALIELKNEYCNKKRCLECGIGNVLLKGK